ncbi:DUF4166 domain-containing protein [Paenarthrobacter sp. Z7-10]|uniref:DUF4166 domain-containing protein n=1 Tax=Paenarthrobacter sp. Z7-10 TaxID=2787635 RepID=UPI0022A91D51|nr:DUF4166 domain-containing protein [Paenarthrobacter sp. Z7-10]MCZ2402768.1 DUF4166 domain-containing protein [Paenarthrobacter sp. Z7-10]
MSGIYEQALGADFGRLQPEVQQYFSLQPGSGNYGVGTGTFDVAGCPQPWMRPLLSLASSEEAFFPEYGEQVPFRIENHAQLDPFGRSSLTARRQIFFPSRTRLFQDTTSLGRPQAAGSADPNRNSNSDQARGASSAGRLHRTNPSALVDYVGKHHRLLTDLAVEVTDNGLLRGVSQASRLLAGPIRLPLPPLLDAKAYAQQWWDEGAKKHRIQVKVIQPQVGVVLVYAGSFDYELIPYPQSEAAAHGVPGSLPAYAWPQRWESRL